MITENLNNKEGIKKLKNISESARVCMFCTKLTQLPIAARPMSLEETDDEGNLWFISNANSNKNFEIGNDNRVQLLFSNIDDMDFLSIYGTAHIYHDKKTIEEKWSPLANAWFDSKDDPAVTIIRVSPDASYYWDKESGKFISFLSNAVTAITGNNKNNDGAQGNLSI